MDDDEKIEIDQCEQQFIHACTNPSQWTASGCGWVTRSYVNEVTTSLDIGMYSDVTTSKLAETFTAHVVRLVDELIRLTYMNVGE